jgi:hypothetical protein
MKRNRDWKEKLDAWAVEFLEGYRKVSELRGKVHDNAELHAAVEKIATQYPQLRVLGTVDVLPEFLNRVLENEQMAQVLATHNPTSGKAVLPSSVARFVDVMQAVTLGLEDPEVRLSLAAAAGLAAIIVGGTYESISQQYFGEAGPKDTKQFMWLAGTILEVMGKTLKTGKPPDLKGKVNVELLRLIKTIRAHQVRRLSYRELLQALEYAGQYFPDEEALRVFEWRARKKGWL